MEVIAADTETFLIGPGAVAPKMVCVTVASDKGALLFGNGDDCIQEVLEALYQPGHLLVGHNIAYDSAVIAGSYPELEPLIWDKYAAGEITDTRLQEQLINLATHGKLQQMRLPDGSSKQIQYHLAVLEKKYLGLDRSSQKEGENIWRLNYHTLDGKPASEYPEDARRYAIDDALGTLGVYHKQIAAAPPDCLEIAPFQAYANFALFLITTRGMAIDKEQVEKVRAELAVELNTEKLEPLIKAGVLRPAVLSRPHSRQIKKAMEILELEDQPEDWAPYRENLEAEGIKFTAAKPNSVNKKELAALIERVCRDNGIAIKKTDKGGISTDAEVLNDLKGKDPIVDLYKERQSLQKLVTTELPRMEWKGEIADVVHFPFNPLLETGRTSSYANELFPSGNGQQLHPKIRPCYKARDGYVLLSTDYSTLELATVGQRMKELFGHSVHADKINAGVDLHAFLAAQLAYALWPEFREVCDHLEARTLDQRYEIFLQLKNHENEELRDKYAWWRKFAKPTGLGYLGGLGPATFLQFAKATYKVDVGAIAQELPQDMFHVSKRLYGLAKRNLGISEVDFTWTPQTKALALGLQLQQLWLDVFEMRPYYQYIQDHHKDGNNPVIGQRDDGSDSEGYWYVSDFGMIRRGCSYTSCCNGVAMQTPAAEGAKSAVIQVVRACRDTREGSILYGNAHVVDFIHDELLLEVRESDPDTMDAVRKEVERLMLVAMKAILPDIPGLGVESVFMRAWDKKADPTFDDQGRLTITEAG